MLQVTQMLKKVSGTGVVLNIDPVIHKEADQDLVDQGKEGDHIHKWITLEVTNTVIIEKNNQNPTNRFGRVMECSFCNSRFHLKAECKDMSKMLSEINKKDSDEPKFNYFMVFINKQRENKLDALLNECMGLAVLDCGCPNTVCGDTWMENYIETLGPKELKKVETMSSQAFAFGDSKRVQAIKRVKIPVNWG